MNPSPLIRAFIFDMDDLLIASAAIWRAAEVRVLSAMGHEWTPEISAQCKGMNAPDVAATLHRLLNPALSLADCQKIMRDAVIEGFTNPIESLPGAVELVRRLNGRAPMAVASGSPMVAIEAALNQLGIFDCVNSVITSESVPRGKPHPDVFLAAATSLNVPPRHCLVFEDSLVGVRAAKSAGMYSFAVPMIAHDQVRQIATRTFSSLAEVTDEVLNDFQDPPA